MSQQSFAVHWNQLLWLQGLSEWRPSVWNSFSFYCLQLIIPLSYSRGGPGHTQSEGLHWGYSLMRLWRLDESCCWKQLSSSSSLFVYHVKQNGEIMVYAKTIEKTLCHAELKTQKLFFILSKRLCTDVYTWFMVFPFGFYIKYLFGRSFHFWNERICFLMLTLCCE